MRQKRRPKRLGKVVPVVTVEDAIRERRERVIDLSKYNVGFDAIKDTKARKKNAPSPSKAQATQYDKYLAKLDKGDIHKFSTRDIMFFFRDTANDNGVKYIIANPKIDMRNFRLALDRGYKTEDILAMIEFLFTSGQTYLDKRNLHPGILVTNWCNKIYQDTQLWLNDEFDPNKKYTGSKPQPTREWQDTTKESKSSIGEWD